MPKALQLVKDIKLIESTYSSACIITINKNLTFHNMSVVLHLDNHPSARRREKKRHRGKRDDLRI